MEISSNHTYRLPAPRTDVWRALAGVSAYPSWWPWLRQFSASALAEGDEWRCTIRPPLPYAIRCRVVLVEVLAPTLVVARVSGDIAGTARLSLEPVAGRGEPDDLGGPGTDARIVSRLHARRLPARLLARVAPGVARWGHDWVFDTAARQFAAAGLGTGTARRTD
jgi:uncharacterized protein YndB with AHSA1/START domain